jgi:hypothetical protein
MSQICWQLDVVSAKKNNKIEEMKNGKRKGKWRERKRKKKREEGGTFSFSRGFPSCKV